MPTRGLINPELLTGIADAIRAKNGTNAGMTPAQMAEAVGCLVVTPEGIVTATGQMTTEQAAQTRENLGVVIDPTLTIDGAAADAKATGNAVGELKSALNKAIDILDVPVNNSYIGNAQATSQPIIIAESIYLTGGHTYTYSITLAAASEMPVYVHLWNTSDTSISSLSLNAGDTLKTKVYTPTEDVEVSIVLYDVNRAVSYTISIADSNQNTDAISVMHDEINEINNLVGEKDLIAFTDGKYINTPSVGTRDVPTTMSNLNACTCFSFACVKGDIFTITGTPNNNSGTRAYMWLNADNTCVYRDDTTSVFDHVEIVAPYTGTLVVNMTKSQPHEAYKGVANLKNHVIKNINDIKSLMNSPLETLPEYITNDLAYKPLGQLQNPYLCLTCDDGSTELESYTIPMILSKGVPCTFGLWSTSSKIGEAPPFSPSVILRTQSGIDAVVNAVSHGCEVAQHGTVEWTDMTEAELNDFFDREQVAFTNMGITVKGAACPSHCVNNKVRAIAGGRFNSVRCGYNGYKSKEDQQAHIAGDVFTPYGVLTGARSNCYSYTSFNVIDKTLNELKSILDNAISNNMCMIVYWHDWDLTASQKEDLEAFIDYAKTTAVNFCTLSEIPTLV